MMMSVGLVFLFGTLGFAVDAIFGHVAGTRSPVNEQAVTASYATTDQAAHSRVGTVAQEWITAAQHALLNFGSVIGVWGGSMSALWVLGVSAAALCMFFTRPAN